MGERKYHVCFECSTWDEMFNTSGDLALYSQAFVYFPVSDYIKKSLFWQNNISVSRNFSLIKQRLSAPQKQIVNNKFSFECM